MKKVEVKIMTIGVVFQKPIKYSQVEEYCQREFGTGMLMKLKEVMEDWLMKALETVDEEEKVRSGSPKNWKPDPDPSKN